MSDSEDAHVENSSEEEDGTARNQGIQAEIKQILVQLDEEEAREKKQLEHLSRWKSKNIPKELQLRKRSFFATQTQSTPAKNLHAVRRHLFLEKYRLRRSEWEDDDDASLLDVVRAQLMEEHFRREYHGQVLHVPPLERAKFFLNVQQSTSEMSSEDLWKKLNYKADWQRIAARMEARGYPHSAKDCYVRYVHKLHPALKKGRFTKGEDAALLKLCSRHQGFEWDVIAQHMPTARTAWRCFERYQKVLNNQVIKEGWSEEDLGKVRGFVEELGYFIDAREFRNYVTCQARIGPGKSVEQLHSIFNRWHANILNQRDNPWTTLQSRALELTMQIYGKDCSNWKKVAQHVPGQDIPEVMHRWLLTADAKREKWTPEEDERLLRAIKKYGVGNWNLMRSEVAGRSAGQMLTRFRLLEPEKGRLYDVLLATKRRVLPIGFKHGRKRSKLTAADFALRLQETKVDGAVMLSTGDARADRHLTRINRLLKKRRPALKGPKAKPEAKPKAKPKAKAKAEAEAKAKAKAEAEAKAKAKAEAKAKAKAEAGEAEAEAEAEAGEAKVAKVAKLAKRKELPT